MTAQTPNPNTSTHIPEMVIATVAGVGYRIGPADA